MNENTKKWVAALRSGNYNQGQGLLHEILNAKKDPCHKFCCLGVACDLYCKEHDDIKVKEYATVSNSIYMEYSNNQGFLPDIIRDWLGLRHCAGQYFDGGGRLNSLTDLNDKGFAFNQIADRIESEPKGLFVEVS